MPEKTNIVAEHSVRLGLNIHWGKSKILKVNSTITVSVTLGVEAKEEVLLHFRNMNVLNSASDMRAQCGLMMKLVQKIRTIIIIYNAHKSQSDAWEVEQMHLLIIRCEDTTKLFVRFYLHTVPKWQSPQNATPQKPFRERAFLLFRYTR